jgi:hypothetical protein
LSNLGRIDNVPHVGDAGSVRELRFSPPGRMPLDPSFGAATLDGRLLITLRYRHTLLDATAARQFLTVYRKHSSPRRAHDCWPSGCLCLPKETEHRRRSNCPVPKFGMVLACP